MYGQQDAARARLSALVREYRRAAGLTQRQLAQRSGLSIAAVRDLEQGRRYRPRSGSLAALAGALGLDRRQAHALAAAADAEPSAPAGDGSGLWLAALGPLAAWRDGRPLELGPPRQRVALGLLALQPGELVRRETVIDVLWGQQPPATATVLVQAQVSRLRRVLDPGSRGGLLEQGRAGYRCAREPSSWTSPRSRSSRRGPRRPRRRETRRRHASCTRSRSDCGEVTPQPTRKRCGGIR
jgi:transcriptional regulator with XRE-family HTH domain